MNELRLRRLLHALVTLVPLSGCTVSSTSSCPEGLVPSTTVTRPLRPWEMGDGAADATADDCRITCGNGMSMRVDSCAFVDVTEDGGTVPGITCAGTPICEGRRPEGLVVPSRGT